MTVRLSADDNFEEIEKALLEAKEAAEQEYYQLQILGRALSEKERKKAEKLDICLGYIHEALSCLKQD